ncbi:P-loop containing nucleoside triphosphate hydrolase protein [Calocera cornea HHB12733]|uniref:DNA 3'-5' helicase n=1 Tax=Calocera cornea HHB12733 TaxID=1353952 RepID=A0A165C537_9BASI|nr:P-loop containing nucleoside triphosphate hydrolase protein [Calocera cornea HHB12733]
MAPIGPRIGLRCCRQLLVALHRQALMPESEDEAQSTWLGGHDGEGGLAIGGWDRYGEVAGIQREVNHVGDLQAGHTSAVSHAHYAVTASDPWRLTPWVAGRYIEYSRDWHRVLGLRERRATGDGRNTDVRGGPVNKVLGGPPTSVDREAREETLPPAKAPRQNGLDDVQGIRLRLRTLFREEVSQRDAEFLQTLQSCGASALQSTPRGDAGPWQSRCEPGRLPLREGLTVAMRHLMGAPTGRWYSLEQAEAVEHVARKKQHVVAVLPCGGGKSLIYLIPTFHYLEAGRFTLCVLPSAALAQWAWRKYRSYGLSCVVYRPGSPLEENPVEGREGLEGRPEPYLVLMSVESLERRSTLEDVARAARQGRLAYLVFDETCPGPIATRALSPRSMGGNASLSGIIQVYLSGALPLQAQSELISSMFSTASHVVVVRQRTIRADIGYHVLSLDATDYREACYRHIAGSRAGLQDHQRGLVFCRTVQEAEAVGDALGCPVYCPQGSHAERTGLPTSFEEGQDSVLVGTSALTMGMDIGHVCWVYFLPGAWSLRDVVLGSGRIGRSNDKAGGRGGGADCWVVCLTDDPVPEPTASGTPPHESGATKEGINPEGGLSISESHLASIAVLEHWRQSTQCRRIILGEACDGVVFTCFDDPEARLCDYCGLVEATDPYPAGRMEKALGKANCSGWAGPEGWMSENAAPEGVLVSQGTVGTREEHGEIGKSTASELALYRAGGPSLSRLSEACRVRRLGWMEQADEHAMLRLLRENRGCCGFCFARGEDAAAHQSSSCMRKDERGEGLRLAAQRDPGFRVRYDRSVKGVCYFCHTPRAVEERAHSEVGPYERKGRQHCKFPDFLMALAWTLWQLPDTSLALRSAFGLSPWTEMSFAQYSGLSDGTRWTKLARICLWWYRTRPVFFERTGLEM